MIAWLFCALLLGETPRPKPSDPELADLISRLAATEARFEHIVLPFEARHHPAPSPDQPVFGKSGWWIRDGKRVGLHLYDLTQSPPTASRAVWDGGGVAHVAGTDGMDTRFVSTASIGHPFTTYLPDWFFLNHWHRPWSELLAGKHGGRVRILGKEVLGDTECTVVQHDSWVPPRVGPSARVWIDAQGRVRMSQSYHPDPTPSSAGARDEGPTTLSGLRFVGEGGESFAARLRWRPLEWASLADGSAIPVVMDQEYLTSAGHPAVRVTIDLAGVSVGDRAAADALLDVRPSRWVPAATDEDPMRYDSARGPEGAGSLLDLAYYQLVEEGARHEGREYRGPRAGGLPFEHSSCGPNAVLYAAAVLGSRVDLVDVLGLLNRVEIETRATNMLRLREMLWNLGLHAESYRLSLGELQASVSERGTTAIVHLDRAAADRLVLAQDSELEHWAVAEWAEGGVRLVSVPHPPLVLSEAEFLELWDGRAILVSDRPIDPRARTIGQERVTPGRWSISQFLFWFSMLGCCVGGIGLVFSRRSSHSHP